MPEVTVKRMFDVAAAAIGLIILFPVIILVASAVRVRLGAPIVFRQLRAGRAGVPFVLYKFRTMLDLDNGRTSDAERLTPFGKTLRATSLDELPQLWNVLRGDMSLVGPRPLLPEYTPMYSARQAQRLDVRPGLTSLVVLRGRNAVSWEEQLELDAWYVDNQSFWLDCKILLLTLGKVVTRQGVSQPGHVTRAPFTGRGK